jgi:tetratricopeptide (TPR) repeat protein
MGDRIELGELYRLQGRYEQAVEVLQALVEAQPDNAEARYNLGRTYLSMGHIYKALAQQFALWKLDKDLAYDLLNLLMRSRH